MLSRIFVRGNFQLHSILQTVSLSLGTNLPAHQEASFTIGCLEIEKLQLTLTLILIFSQLLNEEKDFAEENHTSFLENSNFPRQKI